MNHIFNSILLVLMVALSPLAGFAATLNDDANAKVFEVTFNQLLKAHTEPTRAEGISYIGVDYAAWAKDANHSKAMNALREVEGLANATPDERMAFWINAYNLLTIDLITSKNEKTSIKNLGSLIQSPWKIYRWQVAGQSVTLDQIEHRILRPMGDARVHMAINCASISCPDLRQEAYTASTLGQQLNDQTRKALSNTSKVLRYDAASNTLYLSSIFKWFAEDFKPDTLTWLKPYIKGLPADATIQYMPYNWGLNKTN